MEQPPLSSQAIFLPPPVCKKKRLALPLEIESVLVENAVEELPTDRWTPGFYSRMFLVRKKTGSWRPIINLSALNKFVVSPHFKMETPRGVISAIRPGHWATLIDLTDAFFHISILKSARKFPRFTFNSKVYQFRVMTFGLTTVPLVFTKMLLVVISFLRRRGIDMHIYFDDSLLLHFSEVELSQKTRMVISLLMKLGFIPSREK